MMGFIRNLIAKIAIKSDAAKRLLQKISFSLRVNSLADYKRHTSQSHIVTLRGCVPTRGLIALYKIIMIIIIILINITPIGAVTPARRLDVTL